MLNKIGENSEYLKISDLNLNEEYVKVAYIESTKAGLTKASAGFFTFYIKDCESNIIVGNLFNVEDFIKKGLVANRLRRKPVKIRFITQDFNGSISLLITEIEEYNDIFDYKSFIGFLPNAEQNLESVEKILNQVLGEPISLNREYKDNSLIGIYNGRCGGYCNLLQMVIYDLISYQLLPNIDLKVMMQIFYIVQDRYYQYLSKQTHNEIISTTDSLAFLADCQMSYKEHKFAKIITECISALCGITKPEHLYSVLLYRSFTKNIENINLANTFSTLILTGSTQVGDIKLTKY